LREFAVLRKKTLAEADKRANVLANGGFGSSFPVTSA